MPHQSLVWRRGYDPKPDRARRVGHWPEAFFCAGSSGRIRRGSTRGSVAVSRQGHLAGDHRPRPDEFALAARASGPCCRRAVSSFSRQQFRPGVQQPVCASSTAWRSGSFRRGSRPRGPHRSTHERSHSTSAAPRAGIRRISSHAQLCVPRGRRRLGTARLHAGRTAPDSEQHKSC